MRKFIVAISIGLGLIAIILFRAFVNKQSEVVEVPVPTKSVEVTRAILGEIDLTLHLTGSLEPRTRVQVFPKLAGQVLTFEVDEGDRVEAGDRLAVIEHDELELQKQQATAAYRAAQAAYEQAQKLARIRVSAQVAQARAQVTAAEASLQQVIDLAKTRTLAQMEQAEAGLALLRANLDKIRHGAREEDRRSVQAALKQAEANLANVQSNYNRMKELFENGAISSQSYEAAQTQLEIAQAQRDTAQEQVRLIENGAREEDIQAMEAQVRQAETALKLAHTQTETRSWEKDITRAESQLDAAKAVLQSAEALEEAKSWEAEIVVAETGMEQARVALELAEKRLADATITSPVSGTISERLLDPGGMASPTAPLFDIVDAEVLLVTARVIESDLPKLRIGQPCEVHIEGIATPFQSELSFISPTLDPMTRTARCEFRIENTQGSLRPGMFAKIDLPVEVHTEAVLIPRAAPLQDAGGVLYSIFVIQDSVAERRSVEVGLTRGTLAEILTGIQAGEAVVTAGQYSLKSGERVNVVQR